MDDWPKHDDFSRSFDDHATKWPDPDSTALGAPLNYNPANDMDIGTPIGYENYTRYLDKLEGNLGETPPAREPYFQFPIAWAVIAVILVFWLV